jgi:outer membrane protein
MKTTTTIASLSITLGLLAGTGSALAQDNTVRIGMYAVFYHTSATDVSGPFVPPGVSADVSDVQTLYLAYIRRLSPHFDFELTLGIPPRTDTVGKGPAKLGSVPYDGQTIGTVKWFAPSMLVEYKFRDESEAFRPYVGVGVNFTHFYDRQINSNGEAAFGGPTSVTLSNSIGPVGTVGMYYRIKGGWNAIASYSISSVSSDLEANTGGLVRRAHVSFNPHALVIALGYSF